jgi:hypothetical protein
MLLFNISDLSWVQMKPKMMPSPRLFCSHWKDSKGNLWVTHGLGSTNFLNDTWKFNISQQSWAEVFTSNSPTHRFRSIAWSLGDTAHLLGGLGIDARQKIAFLDDLWSLPLSSNSALFSKRFSPTVIFLITIGSTASIVCVFGMMFCLQRTFESPGRVSKTAYNVRYSPLKDETSLEFNES